MTTTVINAAMIPVPVKHPKRFPFRMRPPNLPKIYVARSTSKWHRQIYILAACKLVPTLGVMAYGTIGTILTVMFIFMAGNTTAG